MTKSELKKLKEFLESIPPTKEGDTFIKKLERDSKPIKVRSAKNKGKNFQNAVAEKIANSIGVTYGNDDISPVSSRPMGQHGNDIILRGDARKLFNYATECKSTETLSLWNTIDQVKANMEDFDNWIIFHKKNGKTPIVIIDMNHFFKLYQKSLDIV